jgi:hypothetical protein
MGNAPLGTCVFSPRILHVFKDKIVQFTCARFFGQGDFFKAKALISFA